VHWAAVPGEPKNGTWNFAAFASQESALFLHTAPTVTVGMTTHAGDLLTAGVLQFFPSELASAAQLAADGLRRKSAR
jgi:hypothetical protein